VLSPLNKVLSIVNMRNDPENDHEEVIVVAYDIEKALSQAELTWAADPFRNLSNNEGKAVFNIDFSKNPAGDSHEEEDEEPVLYDTPAGRDPVSAPFTRHLGRVETQPSASNRLRQSFADEEARRELIVPNSDLAPALRESRPSSKRFTSEVRVPKQQRVVEQDQSLVRSAPQEKTTSIETLTWTPALLQGGFTANSKLTNPDDVFIFL